MKGQKISHDHAVHNLEVKRAEVQLLILSTCFAVVKGSVSCGVLTT